MDKASKKDIRYVGSRNRPVSRPHNKKIMDKNAGDYEVAAAEYMAEKHRVPFPLKGRTTESVRAGLVAAEKDLAKALSLIEEIPEMASKAKIRVTMAEEKKAYLRGVLVHCEAQGATEAAYQPPAVAPVEQHFALPAHVAPVEQEIPVPGYMAPVDAQWTGQQPFNDWASWGEAQPIDWSLGQTAFGQPYF